MQKRIEWIDIAKGVAIIAVIVGHTYLYGNPAHAIAYSFHIPLFFILAGYTFRVKPRKTVLTASAVRLLLPYLAICLFVLLTTVLNPSFSKASLPSLLLSFAFAGGGNVFPWQEIPGVGVAWFLMALFIARILYNGVLGVFEKRNVHWAIQIVSLFLIAVAAAAVSRVVWLPFAILQGIIAMFFMHIGYATKRYHLVEKLTWGPTVLLILVWAFCLWRGIFFSIGNLFFPKTFILGVMMVLAASFVVIKICVVIDKHTEKVKDFLSFSGTNSLLILCLHQVELIWINWSTIAFPSLGPLAPAFIGFAHVLLVYVMVWLVLLNPINKKVRAR